MQNKFKINFTVNFTIIKITEASVQTFVSDENITVNDFSDFYSGHV